MSYKIVSTCIGCTACTKRCPTEAITGERNSIHIIDPELCIDCGACGVVCPVECILDEGGDVCKEFPRREWPKAIVIEDNCIGSGCELCISICPFDALAVAGDGAVYLSVVRAFTVAGLSGLDEDVFACNGETEAMLLAAAPAAENVTVIEESPLLRPDLAAERLARLLPSLH